MGQRFQDAKLEKKKRSSKYGFIALVNDAEGNIFG
jgi:predicted enzyme related to lactoylglutathione lyase